MTPQNSPFPGKKSQSEDSGWASDAASCTRSRWRTQKQRQGLRSHGLTTMSPTGRQVGAERRQSMLDVVTYECHPRLPSDGRSVSRPRLAAKEGAEIGHETKGGI